MQAALTRPQWLGWLAWMRIRGEIGPQRQDFYMAYLANTTLHSGRQFGTDADITTFMTMMPWAVAPEDLLSEDDD